MSARTLLPPSVHGAIDAHVHPWLLATLPPVIDAARNVRPDLAQDFSPARVVATAQASGFSGVVLVNARDPHEGGAEETDFFVQAARMHSEIKGCVVGIDLRDPTSTEALLRRCAGAGVVCGARAIAPENLGAGVLSDPRAREVASMLGEHGVSLDLLIRCRNAGQLREAVTLVTWLEQHARTTVVGDHLLKPIGISEGQPSAEWFDALGELAQCKNFFMKLSGLPGEVSPGASSTLFYPFFDAALERLGGAKLLFGSDHPVSYSHAGAVSAVTGWLTARGMLHDGLAQRLFATTARAAYALRP